MRSSAKSGVPAILVAAVMVASPGFAQAASSLVNGSFESPNIGSGNYTYAPSGAGWTFSGAALVNGQGSNAWYGGSAPSGMDGVQFAALQGLGSLSQSFKATASTLHLGWLDAGRPNYGCCNGDQSYNVLLNGSAVGGAFSTVSGEGFGFNSLNLSGLTVGGDYSLAFQGLIAADQTAFIDNVVLSDAPLQAPALKPSITASANDLPFPDGSALIDDFDGYLAPGFTFAGGYTRLGSQGLDPGVSAPPPGVTTGYETLLGGQSATLTSINLLKNFSLYMGSPDSYNSIRFVGPQYDFTLSGGQLWEGVSAAPGDQSWGRRLNYDFGGYGVNKIVFHSDGNSFEFDNLAGSFLNAGAVPEPATWAMMICGFFGLGSMIRRRRQGPVTA